MAARLPIDAEIPGLMARLRRDGLLVLSAPPGAGKTTRLPAALIDHGFSDPGARVLVLEPRRVAARMAAERVAAERGCNPGEEVGYQVRFESSVSERTRLVYMTAGVFLRLVRRDPELPGVSAVILDEFHERSAESDLCLAFLREVRGNLRPDLCIAVMSATLDAGPIARYLGETQGVAVGGSQHAVEIRHLPRRPEQGVEEAAAAAFRGLLREGLQGSVLIFMPGAAAIRRTLERISPDARANGYELRPLHGDLPLSAQLEAVRGGSAPRVVVATNVAEASLTVEGIEAVIDSGLARLNRHDPARGLNRLTTERISRASAAQRAGRAGRQGPGICLRLYTEDDHAAMPDQTEPEVRRIDLSGPLLELMAWGCRRPHLFPWLDPPQVEAVDRGLWLLELLGAVRPDGEGVWSVTGTGRRILDYPAHPRQGRALVEGERRGCLPEMALLCALLSERDILLAGRAFADGPGIAPTGSSSDLLVRCDLWLDARKAGFAQRALLAMGVDPAAARRVGLAAGQLAGSPGSSGRLRPHPWSGRLEEDLLICLAAAYPDRVVRPKSAGSADGLMVGRMRTRLDPASSVRNAGLYIALDALPGVDPDGPRVLVRMASLVRREWLEILAPDRFEIRLEARFQEDKGRVVGVQTTLFLDLPLEERGTGRVDPDQAADLLFQAAAGDPEAVLTMDGESAGLLARLRWLASVEQIPGTEGAPSDLLLEALRLLCRGRRSFDDLASADLAGALDAIVRRDVRACLEARAPSRIRLPSGRMAAVDYGASGGPALAAPLQEFFGSETTPAVRGGGTPLVLHLLAPNRRPVQVTRDLASFWDTVYPKIRGEMSRRYPKHAWPENPREARPTARPSRKP